MKYAFVLAIITSVVVSCSEATEKGKSEINQINQKSTTSASSSASNVPQSQEETKVEVTFSSGIMKGTHVFKVQPDDLTSIVNLRYDVQVSTLSGNKLISADGKHELLIQRPFHGEATEGKHKAKIYTNDCGTFKLRSLSEDTGYSIIRGEYTNCSETEITACGAWEEGHVYNRRGAIGQFSDDVEMEITLPDGSIRLESSKIAAVIEATEARLK